MDGLLVVGFLGLGSVLIGMATNGLIGAGVFFIGLAVCLTIELNSPK